jgi:hypothetical protein
MSTQTPINTTLRFGRVVGESRVEGGLIIALRQQNYVRGLRKYFKFVKRPVGNV